ncbi:MAG: DUF547 domain-containing protein [Planctomycetota bacterium]
MTTLIFVCGCPSAGPEPVRPAKTEPGAVQPRIVEPRVVEPNVTEPAPVEPNVPDVNVVGPDVVEPNVTDANIIEPNVVRPTVIEPNDTNRPRKVTFHDKCAAILSSYVNESGMVDYRRLRRKKPELHALLNEFAKLKRNEYESWPKTDKIAFWINAYNIQKLVVITDNYPIESSRFLRLLPGWGPDSIRHIDKKIDGIDKQKLIVMNEEFTLESIENRFFRREFNEPWVFFALSHASLGSPPLRNEPYYGFRLYDQLDDQVKRFLSNPIAFRISREQKKVYLSALFHPSWYGKEFISRYGTDKKFKDQQPATRAVLNFMTKYISEQDKSFLETELYSVAYMRYDWRINDSSADK